MTDPKTDAAPEAEKAATPAVETGDQAAPLRAAPTLDEAPRPAPEVPAPTPALPPAPAPRARGGGWATFCALVALGAAGASIAGPSLRPYLAEQLTARFGQHELIGILTGTAAPKPKDAVQIDLAAFDQRVAALAQALGQPAGGTPDPATLAALATALGQPLPERGPSPEAVKLAELEQRFAALGARIDTLDQRLGEAAAGTSKAQDELAARLGAIEQADAAAAQRADGLDQGLAAAKQESAAARQESAALTERLTGTERRMAELEERSAGLTAKAKAAAMLTLVSRVRLAMEMSDPFIAEVKALAAIVNGDTETYSAVEALGSVAAQGVPNMPRLQRSLTPLLTSLVEAEKAAGASWYTRASSLLFWSQPSTPRADAIAEKVEGISRDLRAGQLSSAMWKLRALEVPLDPGVQAWIAEANRRLTADQALRTLTDLAFKRAQG